ncbi:MAG: GNAT family N-acetyltransferase [Dehalococcoidia bacterium]
MSGELKAIGAADLARYAQVPMTIRVERILAPTTVDGGLGGLRLQEAAVAKPYVKDYDKDGGPMSWPDRFDMSTWRIVVAVDHDEILGGAAAFGPAFGHADTVAELWDIRVKVEARRSGVGRALLEYQQQWARERGFRWLKAETQNVNVGACRFYQRTGGLLGTIDRFAYAGQAGVEHEVELDWYFPLVS